MARAGLNSDKLTPAAAGVEVGRQIERLRRGLGRPASGVADAVGISTAFVRRIEGGKSVLRPVLAVEIARALGVGDEVAASWYWLSIIAARVSPEMQGYLRRQIFPILASGRCEAIGGPAVLYRAEADQVAEHLRAALGVVEVAASDRAVSEGELLTDTEVSRMGLIPLDRIVDAFPGATNEIRRDAARRWFENVHPATRRKFSGRRWVSHLTPLLDGRMAGSVARRIHDRRGAPEGCVGPEVWRGAVELMVGAAQRSATSAARLMRLPARRNGWPYKLSDGGMRRRLRKLFECFPDLRQGAWRPQGRQ